MSLTYKIRTSVSPDDLYEGGADFIPDSVYKCIADEVSKESFLLPIEPEMLKMGYEDGYAVIVFNENNEPIACTRLQFLHAKTEESPAWMELGTTWVRQDYRKRGINKEMYRLLLPRHIDKNILATTMSEASLAVGRELGLVTTNRKMVPEHIWKASCTCPATKTGALSRDNSDCILAYLEPQNEGSFAKCVFRVTNETAKRIKLV